ncbi:MAG: glycosyltransferase, partial [Bacteroidetes bacterium]|nr:glycosyltransferase [Bacteroidota bacterium]
MRKVLFIAPLYPDRSPSQRFRFEQFLDYLELNGYSYKFSFLVSKKHDKTFYSRGKLLSKLILLIRFIFIRLRDVITAGRYDMIFIQREAFFLGTSVFEYLLSLSGAKLIFDFDDSIWLENVSSANRNLLWLKNQQKTAKIIGYADMVFAGNRYLADYAGQFNNNVHIIPTTIDTDEYRPYIVKDKTEVCIGWSGSITTIEHFSLAVPFLRRIKQKYGQKVSFKVIGDDTFRNEELGVQGVAWRKQDELLELTGFDIGIMPLPDTEWAKGKCGLKGLQYMSLGIPTIMSPVGVNTEIIRNGINGFLADSEDEWVRRLSELIESRELREKLGSAGRETVINRYSFDAQKNRYLELFNDILKRKKRILYIAHHRQGRSPGQRFRFEQYIDFLVKNGYSVTYSNILNTKDDIVFYSRGRLISKFIIFVTSFLKRLRDIIRAGRFDIVIIYRESFMLGTVLFERLLSLTRAKVVFDYDDAIWIRDVSEGNVPLKWLKRPEKTASLIRMSDIVFAGNQYLADFARKYNPNVTVVPTIINTEYHNRKNGSNNRERICIGWTGTSTTLKHFETSIPILQKIKGMFPGRIYFKVIVDCTFSVSELDLTATKWQKE